MSGDRRVRDAIERWEEKGLVSPDLAATLRQEVQQGAQRRTLRLAQYLVAVTASVVLLTATGLFVARSWSDFEVLTRTFLLGAVGVVLLLLGTSMERRPRVRPVGYLLQTSGLLMLLVSYAHSDQTWSRGSPGAVVIGLLALVTPVLSLALSIRRDPVMPAVHAAIGYAFLAWSLNRLGVGDDAIVWILDGVLIVSLALLVARLRSAGPETEGVARWLYAFVSSVLAGLVLVGVTAAGPLDAGGDTIYAMDVWLGLVVCLALWAIHRAPPWLAREWYIDVLAACTLIGALFAHLTLDQMGVDNDLHALGGGIVGALGLGYGVRRGARPMLLASCLAIVISVWIFGIQQGGSIGAVIALAFTAALLFWVSTRLGRPPSQPEV